jgi:molybdopterin molybdotransferase
MTTQEYLTVNDALQIVLDAMPLLEAETVATPDALNRVLAEPVVAADSLPPFANSSMDGYALRAADVQDASEAKPASLRVLADVAAGSDVDVTVEKGTAARIMTGAPLPPGADAVVPVEDTSEPWRDGGRPLPDAIQIKRAVQPGDYVRPIGEDIEAGQTVIDAGQVIRPQEIGVLASLGVTEIAVVRRPRVGVLATGDELIPIDQALTPGKIRNSNGYTQTAQVRQLGGEPIPLGIAGDDAADLRRKLQTGLDAGVDLFVSSAGVSVGAYDVVKMVLEEEGDVRFWRVRMRPGKPLTFGLYHGVPYLGLPGNPVSAMVSFERFVRPSILKMGGHTELERPRVTVTLQETVRSDGRETYVRAIVGKEGGEYTAVTTGGQGSHMMTSLVQANALVIIPEGTVEVTAGTRLPALMLNWPETVF